MSAQQSTNGHKKGFTIPTLGCKGCEERKQIMGAGSWQFDIGILILLAIGCFIFYKVQIA